MLKCRKCNTMIDTSVLLPDGSVQCPVCGTIYKKKSVQTENSSMPDFSSRQTNIQPPNSSYEGQSQQAKASEKTFVPRVNMSSQDSVTCNTKPSMDNSSFLTKRIIGLPLWSLMVAVVIIIAGVVTITAQQKPPQSTVPNIAKEDTRTQVATNEPFTMGDTTNSEETYGEQSEEMMESHLTVYLIESIENVLTDGRTLVKYNEYGDIGYGIIDKDMNITPLFLDQSSMTEQYIPSTVDKSYYSFDVLPNGNYCEKIYDGKIDNGGFRIYDSSGKMLYQTQKENGAEKIVGAFQDKVLVLHHVSSFSENTWKLYMMDQKGNKLSTEYNVNDRSGSLMHGLTDFGNGIYMTDSFGGGLDYHRNIFNMHSGNYYTIGNWFKFVKFPEGADVTLWEDDRPYRNYIVSLDNLASEDIYNEWLKNRLSIEDAIGIPAETEYHAKYSPDYETIGDGKVYVGNGNYYTLTGEFVCALPSFGDNIKIVAKGGFSGGFAPIILKGADNYFYITIIDQQGNQQYDPVKLKNVDSANSYGTNTPSLHRGLYEKTDVHYYTNVFFDAGYVFCEGKDGLYLINPSGKETKLPENLNYSYGLKNGNIYFAKSYVSVTEPDYEVMEGYGIPED